MALNKEVWVQDIQENFKMNAEFLSAVTNHDSYIVNRIVHIPQAGSVINIGVDRTSFPAPVSQRTDAELTYTTKQFTVDPVLISNLEEFQISYDKRRSIMGEAFDALSERMGNEALLTWATNTTQVLTSGALVSDALAPAATGTRKAVTIKDIANLAKTLDKQGVPRKGRVLLMNPDMFYQLMEISDIVKASYNGFSNNVLETGIVARLMDFDIKLRNHVAVYNGTTAKAFGAAGVAADNLACLAYHPSLVAKATSTPDVLYKENDPQYYGSILSVIQWAGFTKMKADGKGVVALVQSA